MRIPLEVAGGLQTLCGSQEGDMTRLGWVSTGRSADWRRTSPRVGIALLAVCFGFISSGAEFHTHRTSEQGLVAPNQASALEIAYGRVSGIVLFIGDGMGDAQRTAGTWYQYGAAGSLHMDSMPAAGWSQTASLNNPITDSAAGATALATGYRTNNGFISVDSDLKPLTTILERAQSLGWSVGLVTTTQISHATPAAFSAHVPDRNQMTEIARQMLAAQVDVLLGGGEDEFLPADAVGCYAEPGERTDGRDLIAEAVAAGYVYVCDGSAFAAVDPVSTSQLLGLFADEGMIRPFSPTLAEMTEKAIQILSKDPDGFFLMVEGGQIDWAGHANDAQNVIGDVLSLDEAVVVAQGYAASNPDTLVIVTADHETGGMSVGLESSGLPSEDGPFPMPGPSDFYVNWTTGGHTGVDVPVSVQGPWSALLAGTHRNIYIHAIMHAALVGATFVDVLPDYWSWDYIEALADRGITAGCSTDPLMYCPENSVTRAQMAVFLERGMHGSEYTPPTATGAVFGDVPSDHWAAAWIEQIYADGITSGCSSGPMMYCPEHSVSRAQMAVFLERAMHWPDPYSPPGGTGTLFDDVSGGYWAVDWIEQLYADGITSGCSSDPLMYCPEDAVTRAQMAVFLVRSFALPTP
jgi:alkaline phosphatase